MSMQKGNLLIVEDEPDMVGIIKDYLHDIFDEIHTANTIEQALDLVAHKKFALITLDINMQGRNGSEVVKFFLDNPTNENSLAPIIVISGMLTVQFIAKNKHHFAGILVKPFEMNVLRKIAEDAISGKIPARKNAPVISDMSDIPQLKCNVPFTVMQLDERVEEVMKQIRKDYRLKKLFSSMKVNRDPKSYISVHIGMLINISVSISMKLDWNLEQTLHKFVYAAYLHDIALAERNDLAMISSLEELKVKKKSMSHEEYKLVYEHPNIAATTLSEYQEIPIEVITMIRQHHEVPNETGFPSQISFPKIIPFSVIFIIAHDLTSYILSDPNWNIDVYLVRAKVKFVGPHFVKTLKALEMLA
jgi:response regulator RpfG family c-di-GMP phosphodiesterase